LPSLPLIAERASSELSAFRDHGESLDARAGVALGFAGILVALGATAQHAVAQTYAFRAGLIAAGLAGAAAAAAFFPRRLPVLNAWELRQYLATPEAATRLVLLDTEVEMIQEATRLNRRKALLLKIALVGLAAAVGLIVAGTLMASYG
jgi:hypothetical protein